MKSLAIKLLTFSVFSLPLVGQSLPAEAAPKSEKKVTKSTVYKFKEFKQLPSPAKSAIITTAFFISGAGVLLGTGRSIKYEKENN